MIQKDPCVLVCVTDQMSCRRLIEKGRDLALATGSTLQVVSVQPRGSLSPHTVDTLQALYDVACSFGAGMDVLFDEDPALTVAVYARQINAIRLVSGTPDVRSNAFVETIRELLPFLPITIVDAEGHTITLGGPEEDIA
ncbi:MAG: hypothetical protein IJU16_06060 [Clostridia bacterium]|nr:hypothetical protein [Clostridia bacterium]